MWDPVNELNVDMWRNKSINVNDFKIFRFIFKTASWRNIIEVCVQTKKRDVLSVWQSIRIESFKLKLNFTSYFDLSFNLATMQLEKSKNSIDLQTSHCRCQSFLSLPKPIFLLTNINHFILTPLLHITKYIQIFYKTYKYHKFNIKHKTQLQFSYYLSIWNPIQI